MGGALRGHFVCVKERKLECKKERKMAREEGRKENDRKGCKTRNGRQWKEGEKKEMKEGRKWRGERRKRCKTFSVFIFPYILRKVTEGNETKGKEKAGKRSNTFVS